MHKYRLILSSLVTLACLITPFVSSQLFSAPTSSAPLTFLPLLSPQDFIKTVEDNNTQAQNELDTKLAKLLGAAPAGVLQPPPPPATVTDTTQTSSGTTSPADVNPSPSIPTPPASGFNPYAN